MKELHTGSFYWASTLQHTMGFDSLKQDVSADVAIIGGGMSGLICAYQFVKRGLSCVVIEGGHIAKGSSLASTGLLQYSNDIMLSDLRSMIGREQADLFYRYCYDGMQLLNETTQTLLEHGIDVHFRPRSSMQYASSEDQIEKIQQEFEALKSINLPCEYWGEQQIKEHFHFQKESALITHGDAEINPYRFIHGLAQYVVQHGSSIYEETMVTDHVQLQDQRYKLSTNHQYTVTADSIVYAVGYEPRQLKQQLIKPILNRSYVIVTNPVKNLSDWYKQFMLWETSRPYLYLRTTVDGRIMIGGLDEPMQQPNHQPDSIKQHSEQLLAEINKLFPQFKVQIEYAWNATFAESRDQLPFIGEDPSQPNLYYCLGYGGNGTVYSMIGSVLIANLIERKHTTDDLAAILKLDRA